jgi:hypothetical protein
VVSLEHDVLLEHGRLDLLVLKQDVFPDGFNCIELFLTVLGKFS